MPTEVTKLNKSTWLSVGVVALLFSAVFSWGIMYNKVNSIEARLESSNANQRITTLETQFQNIQMQLNNQGEKIDKILDAVNRQ